MNEPRERLLVVDDDELSLKLLVRVLSAGGYDCSTAISAEEAKEKLKDEEFALILSDVEMPGSSGIDLLEEVARSYRDTATLMVTGVDDADLANRALHMGAYGYVIKPFEANEILINVTNALRRRQLEIENRNHRERLEDLVKERTQELWKAIQELEQAHETLRHSREETIHRLAIAAEFRDDETQRHTERMSRYCELIARLAGKDDRDCDLIRSASVMHDVGKIGVPDSILLKAGPLDAEEAEIMRSHCEIGHKILSGSDWELLNLAALIALTHHEHLDGSGYPRGLKGDEIPFEGRVAAIADVFDALVSNRVYRKAFSLGEALEMMRAGRGTHFDPELFDLFVDSMDQVLQIREETLDRVVIPAPETPLSITN
ncbi:MAG: cyclic di-GMP phosphodiesterase [Actinomycetota bacterium]|jgi:putative two-component system response regulator|nr:cyclic di-GMP phosphodiesterase [Actinomycetota bacterium]